MSFPEPRALLSTLPASAAQAVLDAVPGRVAVLDETGCIRSVNRGWREFMRNNGRADPSCEVGVNYLTACESAHDLHADDGPAIAVGLRGVLSGECDHFEFEYPCHSSTHERWYVLRALAFNDGSDRYALVMHENITERKHLEVREADLDTEVAERVQVRTRSLRQENRELDMFVGAVSHDLRAPIRHIRSFAEKLRAKIAPRLTEDEVRLFAVIDGATARLNSMIDELLGLARVSQKALVFENVNLAQVVLRAWANMTPETEGREIEWTAGDLPMVRGDADLLRLAFENLLSNAVKYTSGREKATIEVGAFQEEHEWVVFVRDDGTGFDMKYVDRLFGAFQRLHSEQEFSGVGLGLTNVKRIVERHGGRVWASSRPGEGATFYVSFPRRRTEF